MSLVRGVSIAIVLTGCVPHSGDTTGGGNSAATKLSDVTINLPNQAKLTELFGGTGCPDVKLSADEQKRLTTTDNCQGVVKLLDGFRLTIIPAQCESGITGTNKTLTGKAAQNKLSEKVIRGCKYNVLLELGEIEANKIYYSNAFTAQGNLDVPKTAAAVLSLKVELQVTDAGIAIGFPKTDKIVTTGDVDLSIDVAFGKPSSTTIAGTPPSTTSPNTVVGNFQELNEKVLRTKCAPCHASGGPNGRSKFVDNEAELNVRWSGIRQKIKPGAVGVMPPPGSPQLDDNEKQIIERFDKTKQ